MIDAILLAGGIPNPDSSLYPYTRGKPKAALEIAGKSMLQWILDALEKAETINKIVIIGSEGLENTIKSSKVACHLPGGMDMIETFKIGADTVLGLNPGAQDVVVISTDIPMITPESVDWVINTSRESQDEIYYFLIDQPTMEKKYPGSGRSYTKLKDLNVCGGDIGVVNLDLYTKNKDFWTKLVKARKSTLHMASLIGIDILLLLVLRRISLQDLVDKVTRRLGITGKGLLCPYAELGMDIDKPYQLDLARKELN